MQRNAGRAYADRVFSGNERVFRLNNFNITGTVFVQIAEASVDPVQVVEHIFERLNASKSPITK